MTGVVSRLSVSALALACACLAACDRSGVDQGLAEEPASEFPTPAAEESGSLAGHEPEGSQGAVDLDGRWVAGGRDRFHLVIDVTGTQATVTTLDGEVEWSGAFEAKQVDGPYWTLSAGEPPDTIELHAFVRSPHEVNAILFGENGLANARRVHPLPDELLGEWVVGFADNYHLGGGVASIGPDSWQVRVGDRDVRSGAAFGLGERDGAVQVALRTSELHTELANFVRTPGGSWLGWLQGTDQHMVLHPEGAQPRWIPQRGERVPAPWLERP